MIKTNLEKLVDLAVSGTAGHPASCDSGEKTAYDGGPVVPVGFSGINFTVKVGDSAFDWAGAHEVAPGVAVKNCCSESNEALLALSCIGNEAVIVSAKMEGKDAKMQGTPGVVTGKLSAGPRSCLFPQARRRADHRGRPDPDPRVGRGAAAARLPGRPGDEPGPLASSRRSIRPRRAARCGSPSRR
jgi:hypothetical protein